MFSSSVSSRFAALVVATSTLNATNAQNQPDSARPDIAPIVSNDLSRDKPLSLQDAIQYTNSLCIKLSAMPLPLTDHSTINNKNIQLILDRLQKYHDAVSGAPNGAAGEVAQSEFVFWVKQQLATKKIEIPAVETSLDKSDPKLADQVRVLSWGLYALFAKEGAAISSLENSQVFEFKDSPGKFFFAPGTVPRVYATTINPELWKQAFADLIEKKVPLVQLQFLGGSDYQKDSEGHFVGVGSFCHHDAAYIDLHAAGRICDTFIQAMQKSYATVGTLQGKNLDQTVQALQADGNKILPEYPEHMDPLKAGGVAMRRLAHNIGTEYGKGEYKPNALIGELVFEFVYHEAQHALDRRSTEKGSELDRGLYAVEEVRQGGISAPIEDRIQAESIAETRVRLESFRHSSMYFLRLIGEARADFTQPDTFTGKGAAKAQRRIWDAVVAEVRSDPSKYGMVLSDKSIEVRGVSFTPDQQIMAQIDFAIATPDRKTALIDAVEKRIDLPKLREEIVKKYLK